jgi:hypothetical protein
VPDAIADELGGRAHQLEVRLDLPRRIRPLHLDDDVLAVRQRRAVNLPDRGSRDRLLVELRERPRDREPEILLDHPLDVRERHGRDVVLELTELVDDVERHQVRPRGEKLAELDERRAELIEHLSQPPAAIGGARVLRPAPAIDHVPEPVTRRDPPDLGEAGDVALRSLVDAHRWSVACPHRQTRAG